MRVGVVGCGYWGSKHVRVLQQLSEVDEVVVIDPSRERTGALRQSFPGLREFADLRPALDLVDALVIATPVMTHGHLALTALRAGKHVLVEKPMAHNASVARAMVDEATATGLTLMAGHTFQYNAAVWKLKDLIQTGDLGSVYYLDTARLNLGLYQVDVNVMWDLAPHDISIVNYLLSSTATSVHAWGSSHIHASLEDVAYLRLYYAEVDLTAHIHVSWLDPCKVRRVTVVGSSKMAVYNDLADGERLRIYDRGVVVPPQEEGLHSVPMSYRYGGIYSPYVALREPLAVQDEHFLSCIATGRQPDSCGVSGLAVVETLEAATLSLRRQSAVPVHVPDPPAESLESEQHRTELQVPDPGAGLTDLRV